MTDKEAFESSLPKEINIYLQDGSILDNENVVEDSMVWTTTLCDEDYITIGKCCPSSFEIMIFSDANYPEKKTRINPIIKVTDEENIAHEMDLGLYYVYSSSRTDDKLHRDIVAYDYFYSLSVLPINDFINRFFEETTIYSFTFKELRTSFYKEFGIIDDTPEGMYIYDDYVIGTGTAEIENKLKEINCSARDFLQSICELHGAFGRIKKSGHFMMVNSANMQKEEKNIEKNDYNMGGIEYEDYSMANVSTITFTGTQLGKNTYGKYSSGISGSTYTVSNNIFTLGNGEKWLRQAAETFFNSSSAFLKSYVPAKITGRYIHDISVGDIISVECADETIKSYVFKKTVTGIPFLNQKIESSGSEEYSSVVNLSNINLGGLSQQEISLLQNSQSVSALQAELIVVKSEVADKITVNDLTAENLKAGVATIDSLTATDAFIQNIFSQEIIGNEAILSNLQAIIINAEYIKTAIADVGYITADEADIKYATIEKLNAQTARIEDLETTALTANSAIIVELNAGIADINTLIFGSATGTVIQTEFANSVIAQLGDAQIKSAMIESVSAGKITAGTIYTDDVTIRSKSGNMILSDNTIQISDGTNVRVQIGKDASNDYSINIWDIDGNLMFSQGGITDSAIKSAIIRNDMVSETANISASKLDIDSLFTVINEDNSHTLKSTKIYLDDEGQTLDVVFKELSTSVTEQGEAISSQGTQISTIQGQITSKIWQQDITTATTPLENSITTLNTQYSSLSQDLSGFKTTVTQTYATTSSVNEQVSNLQQQIDGAIETYTGTAEPTLTNYPTNEWTTDTEKDTHIGDLYIVNSSGGDKAGFYYRFEKVGTTYQWTLLKDSEVTKALQDAKEANEKAQAVSDDLSANYSTTTQMNSAITQKANEITTTVSATYTTKEEFEGLEIGGRNLLINSKTSIGYLVKEYLSDGINRLTDGLNELYV